jgi:hypothetical protein
VVHYLGHILSKYTMDRLQALLFPTVETGLLAEVNTGKLFQG